MGTRAGGWAFQTRAATQRLAVDKSIAFYWHNPKSSDSFARVFFLLQEDRESHSGGVGWTPSQRALGPTVAGDGLGSEQV